MSIPRALSVIVGTAGHVDHGKTSLVRSLTGFETDRLTEEKQRGLSIDIAVAPCTLAGDRIVGIVDVPGHEDFIRNMVAGASSIDVLMLVVAADDGIMPQTREHVTIATLLGTKRAFGVITKVDLVDDELRELVEDNVRSFLSAAGFGTVPIVACSNVTGSGIDDVRAVLETLAQPIARDDERYSFRMDIRHAFSAKGHGTVVTGVPRTGVAAVGTVLELLPEGVPTAIRNVQTYRSAAAEARAHVSTALNLRDLGVSSIKRGMTLVAPDAYRATQSAIANFRNTGPAPLPRRFTFRLHAGTAVLTASARLIDAEALEPGGEAFVHLRLSESIVCAAGDRYVARALSPAHTIGGGELLSVTAGRPKRMTEDMLDRVIAARDHLQREERLLAEVSATTRLVYSKPDLERLTQLPPPEAAAELERHVKSGFFRVLGANLVAASRLPELVYATRRAVERYHRTTPHAWGMKPAYAAGLLGLDESDLDAFVSIVTADDTLSIRHGRLAAHGFEPKISPREIKLRESVLKRVEHAGIASIAKGNLKDDLHMTDAELKTTLRLLGDEDQVTVLGSNVLSRKCVEECREHLLALFRTTHLVSLQQFRDATGASRNVAALILDSFDAAGMTKRSGEGRVLVKRAGRAG